MTSGATPPSSPGDDVTVVLRRLPMRLFLAWEEHSDSLLREYVLLALEASRPFGLTDVSRARTARATVSDALHAATARDRTTDSPEHIDVHVHLGQRAGPAEFALLQAVLDDANALSRDGQLLILPTLPEIVALRNWVCEEVVTQLAGGPASPWRADFTGDEVQTPLAEWPGMDALPADVPWIAGDDHNRIIGVADAALELLGWKLDDLVGQRILAVIPPTLREGHVAGFTSAVVTGTHRLLGRPLEVNAWAADEREVPIRLTLERHTALRGRKVYVAWLQPRP